MPQRQISTPMGLLIITGVVFFGLVGVYRFNAPQKPPPPQPVMSIAQPVARVEPAPYRVLETEDVSTPWQQRARLRVRIEDKRASPVAVREALRAAAERCAAPDVMVFGYWPGDDERGTFTAGRLEWSRDVKGWDGDSGIPVDGIFDPGPKKR